MKLAKEKYSKKDITQRRHWIHPTRISLVSPATVRQATDVSPSDMSIRSLRWLSTHRRMVLSLEVQALGWKISPFQADSASPTNWPKWNLARPNDISSAWSLCGRPSHSNAPIVTYDGYETASWSLRAKPCDHLCKLCWPIGWKRDFLDVFNLFASMTTLNASWIH